MRQEIPKVLSKTSEKTLIEHVLDQAKSIESSKNIVVCGYQAEKVEKKVNEYSNKIELNLETAIQENQLGTGDAVKSALSKLDDFTGNVVILYGDVPLVKTNTLKELINTHNKEEATVSILTLKGHSDNTYGRILRNIDGTVNAIREFKDLTSIQRLVDETNSGILVVDSSFLKPAIKKLEPKNAQNEYYLTDIIEMAVTEGQNVSTFTTFDSQEIQGVNTLADLANINKELQKERINKFIDSGVKFDFPESVLIDSEVEIENGCRIGANVYLQGSTKIGKFSTIESTSVIINSTIGENTFIKLGSRIEDSSIGNSCSLGPFCNIRPNSRIENKVKIGNFVELKKSSIGEESKVNHLSYIGDSEIGKRSNIGAGTITCNYDGTSKFKTIIKDDVFVGSNSTLVAPITIESKAYVGAGTLINKKTVPSGSLAVSRAQYKTIENWSPRKKES
ncbi:UNVERIFIED_CONTAM: hypothetical protein GTU68_022997 [Idotea baltica]|nr:hypothetical protein [Idotea baltica]